MNALIGEEAGPMDQTEVRCGVGRLRRHGLVYRGRPADAEDVVQEVFLRLLSKAPVFADGEHEKRWLLRVTANLCRDQLKGFWCRRAVTLELDRPGLGCPRCAAVPWQLSRAQITSAAPHGQDPPGPPIVIASDKMQKNAEEKCSFVAKRRKKR